MKIVLFDDQRLGGRLNTKRVYGKPVFVGGYKEENVRPSLPCVFQDGKIAPYIAYYTARYLLPNPDPATGKRKETHCICMAVSDDCVHWTPYPNDLQFEGKYMPNQILPADDYVELLGVIKDKEGLYRFFA